MKRKITAAFIFFAFFILNACADKVEYAVVVSANMEWKAVRKVFPDETYSKSVWGEFFFRNIKNHNVLFFHEGWGKVAAAGATQYVIDRFNPRVLINLGT